MCDKSYGGQLIDCPNCNQSIILPKSDISAATAAKIVTWICVVITVAIGSLVCADSNNDTGTVVFVLLFVVIIELAVGYITAGILGEGFSIAGPPDDSSNTTQSSGNDSSTINWRAFGGVALLIMFIVKYVVGHNAGKPEDKIANQSPPPSPQQQVAQQAAQQRERDEARASLQRMAQDAIIRHEYQKQEDEFRQKAADDIRSGNPPDFFPR